MLFASLPLTCVLFAITEFVALLYDSEANENAEYIQSILQISKKASVWFRYCPNVPTQIWYLFFQQKM